MNCFYLCKYLFVFFGERESILNHNFFYGSTFFLNCRNDMTCVITMPITERGFYTVLIVALALFGVIAPIIIIQVGKASSSHVYLFENLSHKNNTKFGKVLSSVPNETYKTDEVKQQILSFFINLFLVI